MNNIEIIFFEEYKKLDNLCKDLLGSNQGVTQYVNEMEQIPFEKSKLVESWQYDYKMLKHIRWIRNNIAHNNGDSECSESDVQYVKNFYQRIINRTDSFSLINVEIRKAEDNQASKNITNENVDNVVSRDNSNNVFIGITMIALIIILVIFVFSFLTLLHAFTIIYIAITKVSIIITIIGIIEYENGSCKLTDTSILMPF